MRYLKMTAHRSLALLMFLLLIIGGELNAAPDLEASVKNLEIALDSPILAEEAIWMTMHLRTVFPQLNMETLECKLAEMEKTHPRLQMRYKAAVAKRYLQREIIDREPANLTESANRRRFG